MKRLMKQMKKKQSGEKKDASFNFSLDSIDGLMKMIGSFTILRITSMGGMVGIEFTKEQLLDINKKLNKIRLPKDAK